MLKKHTIALLLSVLWVGVNSNDPAATCVPASCLLPDCLCSSTSVPPGIDDITLYPQIVMLSFDDAVEQMLYDDFYEPLFAYTNPDGCNIGVTYFLSHDYTDYTLVHELWQRGHEIASHSITHKTPTTYWTTLDYNGWVNEMHGLRQIASNFAKIPMSEIVGARAPFLQGGGDVMVQAISDYQFQYDSTMPSLIYTHPPLYPYTLDYKSIEDCEIPPCPKNSYPGFWEVPLVDFNSTSGIPCAMLDSCTGISGQQKTFDFLKYNFDTHYTTNRAPIGYFTHASWFLTDPTHYPGFLQFLDYLKTLPDVYVMTVKKALDWMRSPTKTADLGSFAPWACTKPPSSDCFPNLCVYTQTTPGGERYMNQCLTCPPNYPWLGDPYGNRTAL